MNEQLSAMKFLLWGGGIALVLAAQFTTTSPTSTHRAILTLPSGSMILASA
jgi:hypothetical protein